VKIQVKNIHGKFVEIREENKIILHAKLDKNYKIIKHYNDMYVRHIHIFTNESNQAYKYQLESY